MPKDPRITNYIENAAPFAQPILKHIREAFHQGCPEIEENIKWGAPSFELNGIVGGMAAFKKHATYGFWRSAELDDPQNILSQQGVASFMAEKFTDVSQLPAIEVIAEYVTRAADLNKSGKPKPTNPRLNKNQPKPELTPPDDLVSLLESNPEATETFHNLTVSQRNEYIEWITEAKREPTRLKRLNTTIEWLAEGKTRNWKYQTKK